MDYLNLIGLPLEDAISELDEDLYITIVETKGTNYQLNKNLNDLRVVKYDIEDKIIKIIVCAF